MSVYDVASHTLKKDARKTMTVFLEAALMSRQGATPTASSLLFRDFRAPIYLPIEVEVSLSQLDQAERHSAETYSESVREATHKVEFGDRTLCVYTPQVIQEVNTREQERSRKFLTPAFPEVAGGVCGELGEAGTDANRVCPCQKVGVFVEQRIDSGLKVE